jgi:hypothetical protein
VPVRVVADTHELAGLPATSDFLGTQPGPGAVQELRTVVSALRGDNEFDVQRLRGLLKGARS